VGDSAVGDEVLDAFRLTGKVAVVTGGASGIGQAAARVFAAAGASVVAGDVDFDGAEATAAGIVEAGGAAVAQAVDVTDQDQVEALTQRALDEFGALDVMANVAGIAHEDWVTKWTEDEFDRVFGINFKGTLWGCQAAVARMKESGGGSIINVASSVIDITAPRYGLYAISKQAVTQLTRTLAMESGRYGIRVNVIAPGATVTNFTKRHLYDDDGNFSQERYDAFVDAQRKMSPLGLSGEAVDQANLMLFLASSAARWCTGQTWRCNGGQVFAA
jgi:3-oxoacyl-[acyl-carrier protein] reductase